jgi:heme A synthase
MNPTVRAIADVIFDMKPPHYHAQDYRTWQEWAHRLSAAVGGNEGFAPAVWQEWQEAAGMTARG